MPGETRIGDAVAQAQRGADQVLRGGAVATGVALGGFFDGILLHQVLQWHHLLSLVPGEPYRDIAVQILADGVFHVGMFGIALLGLWLMWRGRGAAAAPGAGRMLAADALLGFAIWNIVDIVFFHWVVGIHRLRVDVPDPLPWDIGWLVVFGLAPLALVPLLRRRGSDGPNGGRSGGRVAAGLAMAALVAGPLSVLPLRDAGAVVALFPAGTAPETVLAAAVAADARIVGADASGAVWVFALERPSRAWRLYGGGALLVGGAGLPAGCLGWMREAPGPIT